MSTHAAAILYGAGEPLRVEQRQTPKPGPTELVLDVKTVAINIVDGFMRNLGAMITEYPHILGSDVAGVVLETGAGVDPDLFKSGTRVAAFASSFYYDDGPNKPDYGAFQARVLVDSSKCVPLPDAIDFPHAALIGMGALVSMTGWAINGIPLDKVFRPEDKQAVIVGGATSGMGTWAVQTARSLGFTVYATASPENHDMVKKLGAARVFDYKDPNVVENMVRAGKEDGLVFENVFQAAGDVKPALEAIERLKPQGVTAKVGHAPIMPQDLVVPEGVSVKFIQPDSDKAVADGQFQYWFNVWLKKRLETGEIVPTPSVKLLPGGLEGINTALDEVVQGKTRGEKLVLEI